MRKAVLMIIAVGAAACAHAVDVPLVVQEHAGRTRVGNPVNSGVPLPKGAVKDVSELRLLDAAGNPVLASIEPRCRWLKDNSLKWVTVHFLADVAADGEKTYRLSTSDAASPKNPIEIDVGDSRITVKTGAATFVVPTDRLAPFAQVFLGKGDTDGLLAKTARTVLTARNGGMRVVDGKAETVAGQARRQFQ